MSCSTFTWSAKTESASVCGGAMCFLMWVAMTAAIARQASLSAQTALKRARKRRIDR